MKKFKNFLKNYSLKNLLDDELFNELKNRDYLFNHTVKRNKKEFQQYLIEAEKIIKKGNEHNYQFNNHPIFDYIKIFTDSIQTQYLLDISKNHSNSFRYDIDESFGMCNYYYDFQDYHKISDNSCPISLNKNPVISPLWDPIRFDKILFSVGENLNNPYKFESYNHHSFLILPVGVTHIHNGLHSSSMGILKGEGIIYPQQKYRLDKLYQVMYFDGNCYIDKKTKKVIYSPQFKEFGIIFEIGRLILENNIEFQPS